MGASQLLKDLLLVAGHGFDPKKWKSEPVRYFLRAVGCTLLFSDAVLLYRGLVSMGTGGADAYFSAFLIMLVLIAIVAFFTFVGVYLWTKVKE